MRIVHYACLRRQLARALTAVGMCVFELSPGGRAGLRLPVINLLGPALLIASELEWGLASHLACLA